MLSHLLCHRECWIGVIKTPQDSRHSLLGADLGAVPGWHRSLVPGKALGALPTVARMGSGCGGFWGGGYPSMAVPRLVHYQGRAEDGSRNLVSLHRLVSP